MASFFNMKGTTQPSFMIGVKGPILTKYVAQKDGVTTTYLQLPASVIGTTIYFDNGATKYITGTEYTGNAATATKLSAAHIGLSIGGLEVSHIRGDGGADSGLSDGSGLIYGTLVSIDSQYLIKGLGGGLKYSVLEDLVQSGDLNGYATESKLASAIHTHSQYLATGSEGFKITTLNGETALGQLKIYGATESVTTTAESPQLIKLDLRLRDGTIVTTNIANEAVTSEKIGNGEVKTANLANGNILPQHLKTIDDVYLGDYTGKIGTVDSANAVNIGGTIAGVNISSILNHDGTTYSSKVQAATRADESLSVFDTTAAQGAASSATAKQIISTVTKVGQASSSQSEGNLVLWTADGLLGPFKGELTGNASTATKLKTTAILWGNEFTGEDSQKLGSANSAAADIAYTGHITPKNNDSVSIGSTDLKYKHLYLTGTAYLANISAAGSVTAKKLVISAEAGSSDIDTGIDLGSTYSLRNANYITVKEILPIQNQNATLGNAEKPFYSAYFSNPNRIYLDSTGVTLKGALDGKSNVGHTHSILELTNTIQTINVDGVDVQQTYLNNIALTGHKHTLSDITDIAGVYRFRGTIESVNDQDENNPGGITVNINNANNGDVYNVLSAFKFNGKPYPAGTNIVYEKDIQVENSNDVTGIWKPLGGVFNLDLNQAMTAVQKMTMGHTNTGNMSDSGANVSYHSGNNTFEEDRLIWENVNGSQLSGVQAASIRLVQYYGYASENSEKFRRVEIPLPRANATTFGLLRLGYQAEGNAKSYPLQLDENGRAFVTVNWRDPDPVIEFSLVTNMAESSTSDNAKNNLSGNGGFADNGFFLRFIRDRVGRKTVTKSLKFIGDGAVSVKYQNTVGTTEGTVTIGVPDRAGYSIPLIKCMDRGYVSENGEYPTPDATVIFSAVSSGNGSGVFGDNGNKIKNGSLVLLYIDHPQDVYSEEYSTWSSRGVMSVSIEIPKKVFSIETGYNGSDSYYFPLMTKDRTSKKMYFTDLSRKLFLCQICLPFANNNLDPDPDTDINGNYCLRILDNIGDTFEQLGSPTIQLEHNKFKLDMGRSYRLGNLIRRYNGIANIFVRTLRLSRSGQYVPIDGLDVNITNKVVDSVYLDKTNNAREMFNPIEMYDYLADSSQIYTQVIDLYGRNKLIDMLCYDIDTREAITGDTLSYNIAFIGDKMNLHSRRSHKGKSNDKKTIGLRKKNGNISLDNLILDSLCKNYMREYSKIKFQFILRFKNSNLYDMIGHTSNEEFNLTKSSKINRGYWGVEIKRNSL